MYKHSLWIISFLILTLSLNSQNPNDHHIFLKPKTDTTCLKDCLLQAHWEAHSRTFVMSTINEGALKDDYAIASGAGIGILTKPLYGFQVGISGFFLYNLNSSNIDKPDSLTQNPNRYEIGLFDVENHTNKHDLDRLEELYIKYNISNSSLSFGKLNLNTPFFNPQDGRMRPTVEEGFWISIKESKTIGFNGGWIWEISPRSTVNWYSLSNSVGIYPVGVNENGKKSDYNTNIVGNNGIAVANLYVNPTKNIKINFWNGLFENVMNTSILEIKAEQPLKKIKLYEGIIYLHQNAINNGGNIDQSKTYMSKGAQANVISAQLGIKNQKFNTSLNYTHITGDGRYLMPREWGREIFYTFLPRERNEGYGNVNAIMIKTNLNLLNNKFKTGLGYGYYQLPDVKNYRLNKYGIPSYHQINYDASYAFNNFLKGMELKLLIAAKIKQGETYNNLKYIYNKVNMINFNLIVDFKI